MGDRAIRFIGFGSIAAGGLLSLAFHPAAVALVGAVFAGWHWLHLKEADRG